MSLKNYPREQRPREKCLTWGAESLSDTELLAIILRTGCKGKSALGLAQELLDRFGGIRQVLNTEFELFCQTPGAGINKFLACKAAKEISRRHSLLGLKEVDVFKRAKQTKQFIVTSLEHHQQEVFAVLFLDVQMRLIHFEKLFFGTIDHSSVHPRIIVKKALQYNAAAAILAHNHPSGSSTPSQADLDITEMIDDALELIDVHVADHIIVGDRGATSMVEEGLW